MNDDELARLARATWNQEPPDNLEQILEEAGHLQASSASVQAKPESREPFIQEPSEPAYLGASAPYAATRPRPHAASSAGWDVQRESRPYGSVGNLATVPEQRRRRREEAERQILDAAAALLHERPYRDLTVDDVMAAAGQSRTAFYRHFKDRQDLLIRLLNDLAAELYKMASTWLSGTGDPLAEGHEATARLVRAWSEHGPLLRAISEAANHDDEVEHVYRGLMQVFVDATIERLRRDVAAGRAVVPDIQETSIALCWMTERYLTISFSGPDAGDPATATEVLHAIWMRAVYQLDPIQ